MHDHVCSLSLYWDSPSVFGRLEKWRRKTEASGDSLLAGQSGPTEPVVGLGRPAIAEQTKPTIPIAGETPC